MSAAAVIAIRRRRIVEQFRQAGATDASHAVTLESLEVRPSWIFDQMVRNGIFTAVGGDHYFMNEQAATEFLRQKRARAIAIGALMLFVFLLLCLFGWGKF